MNVKGQTRTGKLSKNLVETAALALSNMDVVYVVRPGEHNENLKFSLRSLKNIPHRNIFIAGFMPVWVEGCTPIVRNQTNKPDQENSNANLALALSHPDLSENFIFMNDDFFIMSPINSLHPMHQGSLDQRIERYKQGNRFHQAYSLIATKNELRSILPSSDLYSYELHIPMVMNKTKALAMFNYWKKPLFSLRPRTFYGNIYQIKGEFVNDVKGTSRQESTFSSTISGSTADNTWTNIRQRFPAPSKHEAHAN